MEEDKFNFLTEQFDDIKILRYQVPAFGQLPLREKIFVYYLSQAALAGRDILWDQNNRYNLRIRKILERIVREYPGDRNTDEFERFLIIRRRCSLPMASIITILWISLSLVFVRHIFRNCWGRSVLRR